MSQTRKLSLKGWIERISEDEMPIFGRTAQEVASMTADSDSSITALAQTVLQDASMTARILKLANSALYNPGARGISTISRAIVLLGFENVRNMALSVALVDALLQGRAKSRVIREMALAFHTAVQARAMAMARQDGAPEEVFIAALLLRLGDLAFWCIAGDTGDELEKALALPNLSVSDAEEKVLGFTLKQLTRTLAREWRLGVLLQQTLDARIDKHSRENAIVLGRRLAEATQAGWQTAEIPSLFEEITAYTRQPPKQIQDWLLDNARQAVEVANTYGAAIAAQHIPQTLQAQTTGLSQTNPTDTHGSAFFEPDPILQLRILRELSGLLNQKPDLNLLLEMALEGIYRGVGMDRTLFALLSTDRRHLKAKFVLGTERQQLSKDFQFNMEAGQANLLSHVLQTQECMWVKAPPGAPEKRLMTPLLLPLLGGGAFMLAPIVVNQQSIGLFFADRQSSGRALDEESYESFRLFSQQANLGLAYLARKTS